MNNLVSVMSYLENINLLSITLRVLISMICGGVIGLERMKSNQPAGMRTYMLVCMGAAVVMMTGQYMFDHFHSGDPARLGAQVVSGIGFLGAGTIIISEKTKIRGLTTAAGLWTSACIGLGIGIGFYEVGVIGTAAVYVIMTSLRKLEYRLVLDNNWLHFYVELDEGIVVEDLIQKLKTINLELEEIRFGKKQKGCQKAVIGVKNRKHESRSKVLRQLEEVTGIQFVKHAA